MGEKKRRAARRIEPGDPEAGVPTFFHHDIGPVMRAAIDVGYIPPPASEQIMDEVNEQLARLKALQAEQPSIQPSKIEETPMTPDHFADPRYSGPEAMREMTPNEIRAAELAMLLDFVQGDPIDGTPTVDEIASGIKHRITELSGVTEAPQAEQPFDHVYIADEDEPVSQFTFEADAPSVEERLAALIEGADRVAALPAAMEWYQQAAESIEPSVRVVLATTIAMRLTERLEDIAPDETPDADPE